MERFPNQQQGTRTYIRMQTPADSGGEKLLAVPEAAHHVQRFEGSLSDFLTPGLLLKRCFDVVVAGLILMISLPVLGLIALAIRWSSRGPAFHNVFRTGMGFRTFKVYAFRTTRAGADRMVKNMKNLNGPGNPNQQHANLQTNLGRTLVATGLDVLPMFYNVLLGDLSLVGVRALPVQEASQLVNDSCCARFEVPAGIWGPLGRNDRLDLHAARTELTAQELEYVRDRHFLTDLRVLFGPGSSSRNPG